MKYEVHPVATIFPMMSNDELSGLISDIKENGQREPATFWKGKLIDGRNRAVACESLGIELDCCELDEDSDPVSWVVSHNLHRRHLTPSQRGMVALELESLLKPAARERQKAQADKGKEGGRGNKKQTLTQNLGEGLSSDKHAGEASTQAAKALNVSRGTVENARIVKEQGSKELIAAVKSGEVSVSKAAKVAKAHDKKSQMAALNDKPAPKPERGVFDRLRKVFDDMTEAERHQAALLWEGWIDATT